MDKRSSILNKLGFDLFDVSYSDNIKKYELSTHGKDIIVTLYKDGDYGIQLYFKNDVQTIETTGNFISDIENAII